MPSLAHYTLELASYSYAQCIENYFLFFTSGNCDRSEQIWKQRFSSRLTAAYIAFQWVDCCIRLSVHALVVWLLLCIIPPFFPGRT